MSFSRIYKVQREFEELIVKNKFGKKIKDLTETERREFLKELILGLYSEIAEFQLELIEFPTKINETILWNLKEEAIDIFKYALGILSVLFDDTSEILEIFEAKSKYILTKFKSIQSLKKGLLERKKVVIVDIDGVLYPYEEAKTLFRSSNIKEYYRNKLKYRLSGIKSLYPPYNYAKKFLEYLRKKKYFILILTSRPVWKVSRVALDTLAWFEKYNLPYDAIFFERDKIEFIGKYVSDFFAIVEDDYNLLRRLREFNVRGKLIYVTDREKETNDKIFIVKRSNFMKDIVKYL